MKNQINQSELKIGGKVPTREEIAGILSKLSKNDRETLERYHKHLKTDPLTEINDRRGLMEEIKDLAERAKNNELRQVAVVILDIDSFKQVNDLLGHVFGDGLLRMVSGWLRRGDFVGSVARYGGDEFMMVLPVEVGKEDFGDGVLKEKLLKFRQELEARRKRMEAGLIGNNEGKDESEKKRWPKNKNGDGPAGTVSFGGKIFTAEEFVEIVDGGGDVLEKLLKKADERLYQAKASRP